MKNKEIYQQILKLTYDERWMDNTELIVQVQTLSKHLSRPRRPPINYLAINGIVAIYPDGSKRVYSSLESCSKSEQLTTGTIQKSVRLASELADGRSFHTV